MNARIIALVVLLALGALAAPAAVPVLERFDAAPYAAAARCIIGDEPDCIIRIYCFRECDDPDS